MQDARTVTVTGGGFRYVFDKAKGTLTSMRSNGAELLRTGPELDVWRPPISNETYTWGRAEGRTGARRAWTAWSPRRAPSPSRPAAVPARPGARPRAPCGPKVTVEITSTVSGEADAWFDQTTTYVVDGAGQIDLTHRVVPQGRVRTLPYLARIGHTLKAPDRFSTFAWYGRGKAENYTDRKDGTQMGVWSSSVDDQYVQYYRPQDHGNHDDVRWALLTDGRAGLLVAGDLEVGVTPYDDLDRALYPFARQRNPGWNTLHVDHSVTGVGDTPNPVRPEYQVRPDREYSYTTLLRPLTPAEARAKAPGG